MHIVPSLNVGGREKILLELIKRADREKFEIGVCCLKDGGKLYEQFLNENIAIKCFHKRKNGVDKGLYFRLGNYLKEQKTDIVHTHNPGVLIYGAIGAMLGGAGAIINTEHGYEYSIGRPKKVVEALLRHWIDMTISVSNTLKDQLSNSMIQSKKITTIYNGIDPSPYNEISAPYSLRKRFGFLPTDTIVGNVARLAEVKNHCLLLRAMKKVIEEIPQAKLLIVGDGELRNKLEVFAKDLGISNNVVFGGEVDNVSELLRMMDIFVLSSTYEGISITILEAMASGKAVVATNVGGNPEIIINGETGILVPVNDKDTMAQAIITLLKDRDRALLMGIKGRRRVEECFNINAMVKRTEKLYLTLFAKKHKMMNS